jgi:hypothetical protein
MAGRIVFDKAYMAFGSAVKPFERADDVGLVIAEFMCFGGRPFYPLGALADAKVSSVCLKESAGLAHDEDNLDLIYRMRETSGGHFFEIILRSSEGTSYGGWAWGQTLEVTEEIMSGYRVLIARAGGRKDRFEYNPQLGQYFYAGSQTNAARPVIAIPRVTKESVAGTAIHKPLYQER